MGWALFQALASTESHRFLALGSDSCPALVVWSNFTPGLLCVDRRFHTILANFSLANVKSLAKRSVICWSTIFFLKVLKARDSVDENVLPTYYLVG